MRVVLVVVVVLVVEVVLVVVLGMAGDQDSLLVARWRVPVDGLVKVLRAQELEHVEPLAAELA